MKAIDIGIDIISMIRNTHKYSELRKIQTALLDESQISHLSNRKVAEAYKTVQEKMGDFTADDLLREMVDWLI